MHGSGTVNLVGIHAKLGRVERQINEITSEVDRLCADVHRSIVREVREDLDKQLWVYRGETPDVPVEWSVILGEILHNLRSALDHLVWQLVLDNGQEPGRHNAFPITTERASWQKNKDTLLKGVSLRHKAMIECLQPYTGGMNLPFDVSMLRTLNDLSNAEKHRHLFVTVVASEGIDPIDFVLNRPDFDVSSERPPLKGSAPLGKIESGKVLLRFNNPDTAIQPTFQINVSFGDMEHFGDQPILPILDGCLCAVKGSVEILTAPMV